MTKSSPVVFDKNISEETRSNIAKRRGNNIKTLFGLPYKQDIDGEDFVVLGVPYDTSVTNRTGCRFGPRAIRNAYGAGRLSYEQDNSFGFGGTNSSVVIKKVD
jgi:arginase family enzyme